MDEMDLDQLRAELGEFAKPEKQGGRSVREERIIAGFEDIQRFVREHGRVPRHGEEVNILERLYAVRLDRMRASDECRTLVAPLDDQGLLSEAAGPSAETMSTDELRAALDGAAGSSDITTLRHVRSSVEKAAADEIGSRSPCVNFEQFKPLFERVSQELKSRLRQARQIETRGLDEIQVGTFFVIGGQTAYVAEIGEDFTTGYDRRDSRLRVIYDNGTESNVLQRSFQRALYRDEAARVITRADSGPLFGDALSDGDSESGTIYVLRSESSHPYVAQHRELIHKIGVTGGKVETRIAKASQEATYLLADVTVIATYTLANINRTKLEAIFHRIFAPAQVDLAIKDRFGNLVHPKEWFLVPLSIIDEAVRAIRDGSITKKVYDPTTARLVNIST